MKKQHLAKKGIEKQNTEHFTFFRKSKIKTFQLFLLTHQNNLLTTTARSLESTLIFKEPFKILLVNSEHKILYIFFL